MHKYVKLELLYWNFFVLFWSICTIPIPCLLQVSVFRERKALALSLNDTKTAVDELHHMLNVVVSIIILVIWLIILGVAVTHFLVIISSQLLLVVFIFGNTCKTIFESIIFLFVMHPYDVGDRCEVEGVQVRELKPCRSILFFSFSFLNFLIYFIVIWACISNISFEALTYVFFSVPLAS